MNNIVIVEWYDKNTNMTFTGVAKFDTEPQAFTFARHYIRDMRAKGVEAIASPIDFDTLKELVDKGIIENEWYDPRTKKLCSIETMG